MKQKRRVGYAYNSYSAKASVPLIRITGKWLEEAGFGIGQEFVLTVQEGEIRLKRAEAEENSGEVEKG